MRPGLHRLRQRQRNLQRTRHDDALEVAPAASSSAMAPASSASAMVS